MVSWSNSPSQTFATERSARISISSNSAEVRLDPGRSGASSTTVGRKHSYFAAFIGGAVNLPIRPSMTASCTWR